MVLREVACIFFSKQMFISILPKLTLSQNWISNFEGECIPVCHYGVVLILLNKFSPQTLLFPSLFFFTDFAASTKIDVVLLPYVQTTYCGFLLALTATQMNQFYRGMAHQIITYRPDWPGLLWLGLKNGRQRLAFVIFASIFFCYIFFPL